MSEPPASCVKVPCSSKPYREYAPLLRAIFSAQIIIHYHYDSDKNIDAGYYRWLELVEEGRWDWTSKEVEHHDSSSVSTSMPPNDVLKFPCSRESYEEYAPLLKALLEARAINAFLYDGDGNICVDYYHWADLAAWGPWDHCRDQIAQLFPEETVESEGGRRYLARMPWWREDVVSDFNLAAMT